MNFRAKAQGPGRTAAYRTAEIRPQVSGLIVARLFEEGATVTAGQPLYRIDPQPFQAALDAATAALARATANRVAVQAREQRVASLLQQKLVSQQDYDDAKAAIDQVEADIAASAAQERSARIDLAHTTIMAPLAGRIGRSSVTEGAIVTAYQTQALAVIQQLDPIYVDVPQSTADLLRVRRAAEAKRLRTDALAGVRLRLDDGSAYPESGELRFREVTVNPSMGTVTARMVFPNPRGELLPDMFVRAEMPEGVRDGAILVPQQSVMRDAKGRPYVFVVGADGQAARRQLEIEREVGDRWLVADGLKAGEAVVTVGVQALLMMPPGAPMPVTVTPPDAPAPAATTAAAR
ncbi:MAG: efflux RND transporter periplasmic adaptor subunit [Planctomycetes bacterium]|nr:efflux RND transporter periplasmic adaptor subunit [Planctomycetota bacterium]